MNSPTPAFNPARFNDQIDEVLYATAWVPGVRLKRERKDLIDWLRKKANGEQAAIQLADKLEACKPDTRCKSAACPECSYAARQLVTEVARRFLNEQPSSKTTIVCVSIVPADGASPERPAVERRRPRWRDLVHRRERLVVQRARRGPLLSALVAPFIRLYRDHGSGGTKGAAAAAIPQDRRDPAAGQGPALGRQEAAHSLHAQDGVLAADRVG
jgi:hypothetical protein